MHAAPAGPVAPAEDPAVAGSEEMLTSREAAVVLGCSDRRVRDFIKAKTLPHQLLLRRQRQIYVVARRDVEVLRIDLDRRGWRPKAKPPLIQASKAERARLAGAPQAPAGIGLPGTPDAGTLRNPVPLIPAVPPTGGDGRGDAEARIAALEGDLLRLAAELRDLRAAHGDLRAAHGDLRAAHGDLLARIQGSERLRAGPADA